MRQMHPLRLQYEMFSDANPFMAPVTGWPSRSRKNRKPIADDNPFLAMQEQVRSRSSTRSTTGGTLTESCRENALSWRCSVRRRFRRQSGSIRRTRPLRKAAKNPLHRELCRRASANSSRAFRPGGLREAVVRGLIYAGMARGGVDERGFEAVRRFAHAACDLPLCGVQDVGARAVLHAADRSGGRARRNSRDASADDETRRKGLDAHLGGAGRARRAVRPRTSRASARDRRLFGLEDGGDRARVSPRRSRREHRPERAGLPRNERESGVQDREIGSLMQRTAR